ncbi:hypothetical protein O6H91_06G011500 [Diphasiastrum complanatum]|uniref:Uncharacterized protein n=1 Tax=Diphasiastrum complanatum TaxID=34168 RepID=A0ACC2DAU8_DIPCM|nr:hypothetical protein O6H91_06G011500 [Diphasiastrum complanatum]
MGTKKLELRPVSEMSTSKDSDTNYTAANVKAPRMAGLLLRCFTWMMESDIFGLIFRLKLKKDNLITKVFQQTEYHEPPMFQPHFPIEEVEESGVIQLEQNRSPPDHVARALECLYPLPSRNAIGDRNRHPFLHWKIRDYAEAFVSGRITPYLVAERFLSAVEDSCNRSPNMCFFIAYNEEDILRQASESTARHAKGKPLSVLDGVPIAVKDEIDCFPYLTTGGTKWMQKVRKVKDDAACIKRLRACGALLVGKTNMHELGQGTTGINPHYGAVRNPYDKDRCAGGSSGGSAAAVAAGLCPAALGVDGGGSVRMPAALCGVVGLKGTYGRVSSAGVLPLNWTLGSVGILAASVEDTLIMYTAIQGHLAQDWIASFPPAANLPILKDFEDGDLSKSKIISSIKIAKYSKWFDDSDKSVRTTCYSALNVLQQEYGVKVLEVTIPELEEMRLAHFITIGSEISASIGIDYDRMGIHDSGADIRVCFALYGSFSTRELLSAQRMRFRQMHYHMEIFKTADLIVTPTTAATAPVCSADGLKYGELNYVYGAAKLMQYQIAGNFLGLPAISVPIGYDENGLPVGLQLIGRPWSEATLLHLASAIELLMAPNCTKPPEVVYDLLI